MRLKIVVPFLLGIPAMGLAWTSALYPTTWQAPTSKQFYSDAFLQDYSYAGYHMGEAVLPTVSVRIFNVTQAPFRADSSGKVDATLAIQAALDSVGKVGGGVVYLPKGTYRLNANSATQALTIKYSNVVLRGDGPAKTFLLNTTTAMNSKSIIKTSAGGSSWTTIPAATARTSISQDLSKPTKVIPVASTSLFKVGDWVLVRNRITKAWVDEHNEPGWATTFNQLTGFIYCRQITAIDASTKTLTIDVPIRYALFARDTAMVHLAPKMLSEVGIENLAIGNAQINATTGWGEDDYGIAGTAGYDAHSSYVINFYGVRNSWIRKVESYQPTGNTSTAHMLSNGILVNQSRGVTIDSCHMSHGQYGGGGGNGYMYRISANENLIKDSKASFGRHGFVLSHMLASGNVFLRAYDKDGGLQTGFTGSMITSGKGSDHHMHFSHSNLFDNCISENSNFQGAYRPYGSDPMHNLTAAHSTYWNTKGLGTGVESKNYLIISQQARYGYVIGTQGTRTTVNNAATGDLLTKTAPLDSIEGIGLGTTLSPQSLYASQYQKRMATQGSSSSSSTSTSSSSVGPVGLGNTGTSPLLHGSEYFFDLLGRSR
jgi:hypothetical protein